MLGDGISSVEIIALLVSFGGVLLIATSEKEVDESKMFGKDSITGLSGMQAQIIGCTLCLITSWCYASVVVFTRIMQRIPAFVLNTYYSCVAAFATAIIIYIESQRNGGELRIFTYNKDQYIASLGCSFINVIGMTCQTIAL